MRQIPTITEFRRPQQNRYSQRAMLSIALMCFGVFFFANSTATAAPSISSISPSSPTATVGNQNVTVFGSGFQSGLTVTVGFPSGGSGTLSGTQIQNVSASSFVMIIDFNGNPGSYSIRVNQGTQQSNTFGFTVQTQTVTPSISSISPSSPTATVGNQNVTVFGSNFQSGLTVTVGFPSGGSSTLSGTQIQSLTSTSFVMVINFNGNPGSYTIRVNQGTQQSNTFSFTVQAQVLTPSISSISPSSPNATVGNQNVTVFGSNFQSGLTVTVGFPSGGSSTLSGSQIQSVSASSFVMVINFNGNPGGYTIRVNQGTQQSNTFSFTVQAQVLTPSISSISPSSPTAMVGNQNVTVFGSNFQLGLTITVGFPSGGSSTLSGSQIQSVTASSFVMVIDFNGNSGSYTIRVNQGTQQSNTFGFTVQAQVLTPSISSISPSSPTATVGNQNVTVFGSNFQSGLTVTVGFPSGGSSTLSGTQIQSLTSTSFIMVINFNGNAGGYTIRVNQGTQQSNTFSFTVQAQTLTPSISSISPSSPTATVGNQNVTVFGSNFQSGLTVTVGFPSGGSSTLSGSQIQSVTTSSFVMVIDFNGNPGGYTIRVNQGTQSNIFSFTVQAQTLTPSITSISPSSPTATVGNQNVTVFGSNFQSGLTVTVGFPSGGSSTLSGSQIQGVSSSSFVMVIDFNGNPGSYTIRVNQGTQQSNPFSFTVQAQTLMPSISAISPSSPTATVGNQNVTVFGSNFQSGLTVTVGFPSGGSSTLSGTQIQSVSASSFVMVIDFNGNAGGYTIRVNQGTQQSNTFNFSVQTQTLTPTINSISPSSPMATVGNQNVTVLGSNFQSGLTVTVGFPSGGSSTLSGTQIQSVSAVSFVMVIDFNGNPGTYTIRVNQGNQQSNIFSFTVQSAGGPVINSISPSNPTAIVGNQNVTVFGSNFQSSLTVTVGFPGGGSSILSGTQIQSVSASSFVMVIDFNGNAGGYTIRVNQGTQQSNTFSFNVQAAGGPVINSISPTSPTASVGNQNLTVFGSNFQSGLTVTVGFPSGGSSTLSGTQIQSFTSTAFVMVIDFNGNHGSYTIRVNQGTQQSNTFSFTVNAASVPTITGYSWSSTPAAGQNFGGTVSGTGFVVGGTQVYFCAAGTNNCFQHPSLGVAVSNANTLTLTNVNLTSAGSYEFYVQTSAGASARSSSFTVNPAAGVPTITGYSWTSTPTAGQNFGGTISGTGFVVGGTQVYFCATGTNNCFQHPSAGVAVSNANSLTLTNVNLTSAGSYEFYVQTSAGTSGRSTSFTVNLAAGVPTITGYSWTSTPTAGQNFGGTVSGTGFVVGGTQVYFCAAGTNNCFQHPAAGTTVPNANSLTLANVNLTSAGSYDFYVQTSAGQSVRLAAFTVVITSGPPTIQTNPNSGSQGTNFNITGTGFTPRGAVRRYVQAPGSSGSQEIGAISADDSGQINWPWLSTCSDATGTWLAWALDVSKNQQTNPVNQNLISAPSCASAVSIQSNPASGPQGTTFTITGSGFTPNGTVRRLMTAPGQGQQEISSIRADASGNINWPYTSTCQDLVGTWTLSAIDVSKNQQSNSVTQIISADPSCAPALTDRADLFEETYKDNTVVSAGTKFTKTWTLRNTGTTTWNQNYRLEYISGDAGCSRGSVVVSQSVAPNQTYPFSVQCTAPNISGNAKQLWQVTGPNGTVKVGRSQTIWISISVPEVPVELRATPETPLNFQYSIRVAGPVSPKTVVLRSTGRDVPYAAKSDSPWLIVQGAGASTPDSLSVGVLQTMPIGGPYQGVITISSPSAPTVAVSVTLNVTDYVPQPQVAPVGKNILVGLINRTKDTVVLTHGLSGKGQTDFWTGTGDREAANLINLAIGNEANIVQYVWEGAQTVGGVLGLPTGGEYVAGRSRTYDAGMQLAYKLIEALGPQYGKKIHFIGHSLGTIVNTYAAAEFLRRETDVHEAQFTALDRPQHINKIPHCDYKDLSCGLLWGDFEKNYGFDENFFASNLPVDRPGLTLKIDNYYSQTGAGVGDVANGPVYNQKLDDPGTLGAGSRHPIFGNENFSNDHSGVHQWYRWTIFPHDPLPSGSSVCDEIVFSRNPGGFNTSLNPCGKGWYWSILTTAIRRFPTSNGGSAGVTNSVGLSAGARSATDPNTKTCDSQISNGSITRITCTQASSPYSALQVNIPADAVSMSFTYNFASSGEGDYAAVALDNTPIWTLGSSSVSPGIDHDTGPIPIKGLTGNRVLTVALYGIGTKTFSFSLKEFAVHTAPPTTGPGIGATGSPAINSGGIVSAAGFSSGLSRGAIASLFGTALADSTAFATSLPLSTTLGNVQVSVNGVNAPLFYVSPTQLNFQVPFEAPLDGQATIVVYRNGVASSSVNVTLTPYSPRVFTYERAPGIIDPVIVHGITNQPITPDNPAVPGETIVVYATGIGDLTSAPATGAASPSSPLAIAKLMPTITIGGIQAQVQFAGLTPGLVGLAQLNVQIPSGLPSGSALPMVVDFNGFSSPPMNISVGTAGPR